MKSWWKNQEPLFNLGSDGQVQKYVYARQVKGSWEYAIVSFHEGDGPSEPYGVLVLKSGTAKLKGEL